ncbi:MAG: tetratricopeptide repeat protein [Bryobacterales bacterium]|nr:tetratricopeptide repeat protein [Bryobacterales bacterium]
MSAFRGVLAVGLAISLAACAGGVERSLPAIPDVTSEDFPESARDLAAQRIRAVEEDSGDPWANGDLGTILHAYEQLARAAVLYERAETLSSGEFRWSYLRGVALQEAGRHGEAAASFRRALAKRTYAPAAVRLGESLVADGNPKDAEVALRTAVQLDGGGAAAIYALGRALVDLGKGNEAIPVLERALSLAPSSGAVRYALAMAQRAAGNEQEAKRQLEMLAPGGNLKPPLEDPVFARVEALAADEHYFLNTGKSLEAAGRLDEAIRSYEQALELAPRLASAHVNLVGAFGRLGDSERARAHYDAAISIDPDIEELHNNWGIVLAAQENPSAAMAAFRRALEVNPNSSKAHANLGVALTSLDQVEEAIEHFRLAIANDPNNRPARLNLGAQALEYDRPEEAARHLEAALEGDEDGSGAFVRFTLGRAYRRLGRDAEASEEMAHALRLAEENDLRELANLIELEIGQIAPK